MGLNANNPNTWKWSVADEGLLRKEDWEDLREELNYGELKKQPEEQAENNPEHREYNQDFVPSDTFQWIIISIIAIAFIIVLFRMMGVRDIRLRIPGKKYGFTQRKIVPDEPVENQSDADEFYQAEDYRNAIRVLYLRALKGLHERGALIWQKDKTNSDYLRELSHNKNYSNFRNLSRIYEQAWFGEEAINNEIYSKARSSYELLISATQ